MQNSEHNNAGITVPPPLVYFGPLLLGLLLNRSFPLPLGPRRLRGLLGGTLLTCGIALLFSGFRTMQRAGTSVNPTHPTTTIVTRGPYRFSRNPLYLGMALVYSGIALFADSLWSIVLLPLALRFINRNVIDREERYLERKFGEQYTCYKERVPRWFSVEMIRDEAAHRLQEYIQ